MIQNIDLCSQYVFTINSYRMVIELLLSKVTCFLFSDTVTRSAMFCAIVTIIDRWKTEGVVDVFQVIKDLRVQKPGAVPTLVYTL